MDQKSGKFCIIRSCHSKVGEGLSFFRLPKDAIRINQWLTACKREDLLVKGEDILHKNYRVCELHFERKYFSEHESRKLLFNNAVPTIFPQVKHVIDNTCNVPTKVVILSDSSTGSQTHTSSETSFLESSVKSGTVTRPPMNVSISVPDILPPITPPLMSPTAGTQTPLSLSKNSPRKKKLRFHIRTLRKQQKKIQLKSQKQKKGDITLFKQLCNKLLDKPFAQIVKAQSTLKNKKAKAKRYSTEYKQFALVLNFLGPRAYNFLRKILYLPTKRTLRRMTEGLVTKTGLNNPEIFKALKLKSSTMLDQDKHCSICIDEMSIKSNLFFDLGKDEIVGLYDVGDTNKEPIFAGNALVIMARGLYSNWKQPPAYFFIDTEFKAQKLLPNIVSCIKQLFNSGLYVDCLVSDMGSNFFELSKLLKVTPDNPMFEVEIDIDLKASIVYIFDPCHLIKAIRNNLITNVFSFEDKKTSWKYIEMFYHKDKNNVYKCAPKLTNSHIYPSNFEKMRVKLATQVLSGTVSSSMNTYVSLGLLNDDAIGTIEFLSRFNNLFDLVISTDLQNPNQYKKVYDNSDEQAIYLEEMFTFIQKLKIYDQDGTNVTNRSRAITSWLVTIKGVQKLWDILSAAGFKYIKTRRLTQDCLENLFGSIRQQGGNCVNPTPIQFKRAFKKIFCQSYLHSNGMNCEDDLDKILMDLKPLSSKSEVELKNKPVRAVELVNTDYRNEDLPTQNAFKYVCGYLLKKALNIHRCDTCIEFSRSTDKLDTSLLFTYFKAFSTLSTFGGLRTPNELFVEYVYKLEQIFSSTFEKLCTKVGISNRFLNTMKNVDFTHPCMYFPYLYVLKLFIRLRLYHSIKHANRNLKNVPKRKKKNRKIAILSHL